MPTSACRPDLSCQAREDRALASLMWPGRPGNSDKSQGRCLGSCILLKFLLCGDKTETSGWILPETHWSPHSMTTVTESLSNHSFLIEQGPWTWTSPLAARHPRLQFPHLGVCLFPYNLTPSPPEGYQKNTFPIKLGNWLTGFWKKQVLTLFSLVRQRQTGAFPHPQPYAPASPSAAFSGPESFSHNMLKGSLATALLPWAADPSLLTLTPLSPQCVFSWAGSMASTCMGATHHQKELTLQERHWSPWSQSKTR